MQVFTEEEREHIRQELVAAAEADSRISGAAHLGSAVVGRLDQWSDIDLALCLAAEADLSEVLVDWTQRMYNDHAAITNYDVRRSTILYRVFLLNNTLQVDLSFWRSQVQPNFWRCRRIHSGSTARFDGPDRNGLATCAARTFKYCARPASTGGTHVEWHARQRACACV
jgi:hypothetical protein